MLRALYILTVLSFLSIAACRTTIKNEFHGEIRNLNNDGRVEIVHSPIIGTAGGYHNGMAFDGFHMAEPEFSFYLQAPDRVIGKAHVLSTKSKNVTALLLKGKKFPTSLSSEHSIINPAMIRRHGGINLNGKITTYYQDKSSTNFKIGVELSSRGKNPISIKGEIISSKGPEFEPRYLHPDALILIPSGIALDVIDAIPIP